MSLQATRWALARENVTPLEKLALVVLADCADWNFQCWPTGEALAGRVGVARNRLTTLLRRLESADLIRRKARLSERGRPIGDMFVLNVEGDGA